MPRKTVADPGDGDPLVRIGVAFDHPLRVRIVRALIAGPGSATTLSKSFDDCSVGDLFYHLTVLERCRVVDLRRSRRVRGGTERIFELRPAAGWGDVWDSLPPVAVGGLQSTWLREYAILAVAALESPASERRPSTVLSGRQLTTDEQGLAEIGEVFRAALADVERIAEESRQRLDATEAVREKAAVIGAAAFEVPSADWWELRRPRSSDE